MKKKIRSTRLGLVFDDFSSFCDDQKEKERGMTSITLNS